MDERISIYSFDRKSDMFKAFKYAKTSARICILTGALGSSMIERQTIVKFSMDHSMTSGKIAKKRDTKKSHPPSIAM